MIGQPRTAAAFCAICCADIHGRPHKQVIGNTLVSVCSDCSGVDVKQLAADKRHRTMRANSKARRDTLTHAGKCLNGAHHGKATHGRRCEWCAAVHAHGLAAVLADPFAPKRPESRRRRAA